MRSRRTVTKVTFYDIPVRFKVQQFRIQLIRICRTGIGGVYVYDKYSKTSKLNFNLYFSIVRFVPLEAIYSGVSKQYLGPSSIEGISITSKSSFTFEYQTKYIPGAYPITIDGINSMRWILTTLCYEYYFEPNTGYYLTVQVAQDGTRTIINKTNDLIVGVDDITNDDKR